MRGSDGEGAHEPAVRSARLSPLPGRTYRFAAGTTPPSAGPANEALESRLALSSERTRAEAMEAAAPRIAAPPIAIGKTADASDSHLGYV